MNTCRTHLECGVSSETCPDADSLDSIAGVDENTREDIPQDCETLDPQDLGFAPLCPGPGVCAALATAAVLVLCVGNLTRLNAFIYFQF